MTGSVESASNNRTQDTIIIVPNWLGDGIMAMPALQLLRKQLPDKARLDVMAKPGQVSLWDMHPDVGRVYTLPNSRSEIQAKSYSKVVLLPNSFRSAWMAYRCGIPKRRGTADQFGRSFLINDPVDLKDLSSRHQQWEMARLICGDPLPPNLPAPCLLPTEAAQSRIKNLLRDLPAPWLGVFPGAARGPSKQWPEDRFQSVAQNWISQTGGGAVWMGTPDDVALCERCSLPLGKNGLVLAGKTSLQEAAAAITELDVVLANDSGGMHLATALNTPVVAVFGITDPGKTGPLSHQSTVIQHSDRRNRRVPRECPEAQAALESISVPEVSEAVLAFHS